ncbi:ATPase, AAA-type, core [Dillenia turbinata]|uniref:Origin recognition complex subunit 1 n=1 Tax=Dillenia turbinata TaxID=194707 RepID=A0AAN8ZK59_9MAGN
MNFFQALSEFDETPQAQDNPPRRSTRNWQPSTPKFNLLPEKQLQQTPRRSCRRLLPETPNRKSLKSPNLGKTVENVICPQSPEPIQSSRKRNRGATGDKVKVKKKVYYKKVVYAGGEFEVGDDVHVKRREDAISDCEDPEVEQCRICFKSGKAVMICLRPPLKEVPEGNWICGFCEAKKLGTNVELPEPPKEKKRARTLRERLLSSDLWAARIDSLWKDVDGSYWFRSRWYMIPEETADGRQPHNLRRELYCTNDFADVESSACFSTSRWIAAYIAEYANAKTHGTSPQDTTIYGLSMQAAKLSFLLMEDKMESIIRHCYVMNPKEFSKTSNEGDGVFLCENECDIHWHSFKHLAEIDDGEEGSFLVSLDVKKAEKDEDWNYCKESDSDTEDDVDYEEEKITHYASGPFSAHELAANSRKGQIIGLQKIGTKRIPEHTRFHKQTELEKAKSALLLATLPKSLPCRNREMEEIAAFIKGAICDDQFLGSCFYIHGVPGTGKVHYQRSYHAFLAFCASKSAFNFGPFLLLHGCHFPYTTMQTMSVLAVMRNLRSEVDAGSIKPYCFIEVNGLKLATPENIYRVIYEAISGHRVHWRKALQLLNERFSNGIRTGKHDDQPCILLIDELDLLVTRNQSVLYNLLDWPTRPHSKLIVIGMLKSVFHGLNAK